MPRFNIFNGKITDDNLFIYIERFDKSRKYLLFDFLDSNEFELFNNTTGRSYQWQEKPTMVEVLNYSQKSLKEGATYSVKPQNLRNISEQIEIVEDSFIIGFRIILNEKSTFEIGKATSFNEEEIIFRNIDQEGTTNLEGIDLMNQNIDKVIVRSIGQGNWNELWSQEAVSLIFDCGTIYTTKRTHLINLVGNRNLVYQESKPILILSHWDVDHYHFLLAFTDDTIKSIKYFIHRSKTPNLTARKAIGRFHQLNPNALRPVSPIRPVQKRSGSALHCSHLSNDRSLLFFNSEKNGSRNKCGLGLAIRKIKRSVILSGDYDYGQVSSSILPYLHYKHEHFLIVPHHGGKAGKFVYCSGGRIQLMEAIISVGKNPYRPPHPFTKNINDLVNRGFKVLRTDYLAFDYTISLV